MAGRLSTSWAHFLPASHFMPLSTGTIFSGSSSVFSSSIEPLWLRVMTSAVGSPFRPCS